MKKLKIALLALVIGLSTASTVAFADPYDWRVIQRNSDDTEDVSVGAPSVLTNKFAVFGQRYSGETGSAWYYLKPGQFTVSQAPSGYGDQNYEVTMDLSNMNPMDLGNLSDLLDAKQSTLPSQTGNSGKFLSTNGSALSWMTGGTVTSVIAGTGLSGGTITGSGTISLPNTGTAGTYGAVTTDAQGRVTAGKSMETFSGTTNSNGNYTVTFGTAYSVAPNIQANIVNGSDTQTIRITNISTTGFTVLVRNRTDTLGLLPSYANVNGAAVDVLITEK